MRHSSVQIRGGAPDYQNYLCSCNNVDRGVQFGKRPALSEDQISELCEKRGQGILIKDLMAHYDLSKATIYRYLGTKDT